eukprot:5757147-Pleurochrysis_carterae.AAC.1
MQMFACEHMMCMHAFRFCTGGACCACMLRRRLRAGRRVGACKFERDPVVVALAFAQPPPHVPFEGSSESRAQFTAKPLPPPRAPPATPAPPQTKFEGKSETKEAFKVVPLPQ